MKRILLLFSALMLSCIALWAHDVEIDGIYYNLDVTNKTAEVTYRGDYYYGYYDYYDYGYFGSVTIPETITYNSEIYSVTSIGRRAFADCSGLTSVTIPNSVTSIGQDAFSSCSGLTSVTIPNSVTSIGSSAFSDCSGLTSVIWNAKNCADFEFYDETPFYNISLSITSFTFGNEVEHIPACLCHEMSKLTEMTIPNSVTSIGSSAFSYCSGLTEVTIGESVTSIGNYAFSYCSGLTSVTIPNSVTSIGDDAFYNCSELTKVNYLGTVDKWVEIDFRGYYSNPTIYAEDLYINNELLTDVKITSAYSINDCAFINCQSIKSVEIGNSVTSIGWTAFADCSGLTSVTIPNSVTSIGGHAFADCSGLTSITIPNTVTSIGSGAFYNTGIYNSESNWDNGVLYIDNCLIEATSDVVKGSYTIKKGTRIIGNGAFEYCSGLTSVTIPNSVTSIGYDAFYDCSGLTSVTIPNSVTSIGQYAFARCSGLTSVTIPNSVTSIGNGAFEYCSGLTSVTIPNSVTSIGQYAFAGCSGLTSVTIPNSVTSIVYGVFSYCSGLTSVTIGESVTSIDDAFSGCDKLRKVTAYPTTVPIAYECSFAHYNAYLYVPCDVYADYYLDDVFGNFEYIKCIAAEEDEPTSITETLADANITVSGGTISADAYFSIYNTIGQDVTAFNGCLQPGVYLVSIENNIVKVMVK